MCSLISHNLVHIAVAVHRRRRPGAPAPTAACVASAAVPLSPWRLYRWPLRPNRAGHESRWFLVPRPRPRAAACPYPAWRRPARSGRAVAVAARPLARRHRYRDSMGAAACYPVGFGPAADHCRLPCAADAHAATRRPRAPNKRHLRGHPDGRRRHQMSPQRHRAPAAHR